MRYKCTSLRRFGGLWCPIELYYLWNDDLEPGDHQTYEEKCISNAPLSGPNFEADAKRVHNIIIQLLQGEHSEQWIKKLKSKQYGRADLKALTSFFRGEGYTTSRIAEAERLR